MLFLHFVIATIGFFTSVGVFYYLQDKIEKNQEEYLKKRAEASSLIRKDPIFFTNPLNSFSSHKESVIPFSLNIPRNYFYKVQRMYEKNKYLAPESKVIFGKDIIFRNSIRNYKEIFPGPGKCQKIRTADVNDSIFFNMDPDPLKKVTSYSELQLPHKKGCPRRRSKYN